MNYSLRPRSITSVDITEQITFRDPKSPQQSIDVPPQKIHTRTSTHLMHARFERDLFDQMSQPLRLLGTMFLGRLGDVPLFALRRLSLPPHVTLNVTK